jgi:hypothetical protein
MQKQIAAEPIRAGDVLWMHSDGRIGRARADQGFNLKERAIRRMGRILGIRRYAQYHERPIIGIAIDAGQPGATIRIARFSGDTD